MSGPIRNFEPTMSSMQMVDYINEERKAKEAAGAPVPAQTGISTADQAAAAMAAESARKVSDAEKAAAGAAARVAVEPLAVLARELRGLRAESVGAAQATLAVLS